MKICLQGVQIEIHLACHFDSAFADKSVFQDRIDYRSPSPETGGSDSFPGDYGEPHAMG